MRQTVAAYKAPRKRKVAAKAVTNRHPVDKLADVRAEIKRLQEVETQLKDLLLPFLDINEMHDGKGSVAGDEFICTIAYQKSMRLDRKMLEADLGKDRVESYLKASESIVYRLEPKAREE